MQEPLREMVFNEMRRTQTQSRRDRSKRSKSVSNRRSKSRHVSERRTRSLTPKRVERKMPAVRFRFNNIGRGHELLRFIRSGMTSIFEEKGHILRNEDKRVIEPLGNPEAAQSLMEPNTVYTFSLFGYSTIVSTAGSIINVAIPMDPSSAGYNFTEWANLSALFDEVRLSSFHVQIVPYFNSTVALVNAPLAIGTNLVVSTAPGTIGAVINLADAYFLNAAMRSNKGHTHHFRATDLAWSAVSSVTVTPYAGCPGSIQMFCTGYSAVVNAYQARVCGVYQFRARA